MALQMAKAFGGLAVPAAYIRIDRVFGGKREGWAGLVSVYASVDAAAAGHPPIEQLNCTTSYVPDQHPLPALYAALKADLRFVAAIDV